MKMEMETILSVLAGGIITFISSQVYYKKAGDQLKAESIKLRQQLNLLMLLQKDKEDIYTPKMDAEGNYSGLTADMKVNISDSTQLSIDEITK